MEQPQTYNLQQAMNVMKSLSKQGRGFNLSYMKVNGGRTTIIDYRLIKQNLKNDRRGNYKLQFINDNDDRKSCYIPLLMYINGIKITLE
jgi:hypothetical protein